MLICDWYMHTCCRIVLNFNLKINPCNLNFRNRYQSNLGTQSVQCSRTPVQLNWFVFRFCFVSFFSAKWKSKFKLLFNNYVVLLNSDSFSFCSFVSPLSFRRLSTIWIWTRTESIEFKIAFEINPNRVILSLITIN